MVVGLVMTACTNAVPPPQFDFGDVAILVVDDFDSDPGAMGLGTPNDNCVVAEPRPSNVVGPAGAGNGLPPGVSHGSAVYGVLADELDSTAGLHRQTDPGSPASHGIDVDGVERTVARWTYAPPPLPSSRAPAAGSDVLLVGVSVRSYRTDEILARLQRLVTSMRRAGYSRFVLNLSFVVVPCDIAAILDEAGAGGQNLLARYEALIATLPEYSAVESALKTLVAGTSPAKLTGALLAEPNLGPLTRRVIVDTFYGLLLAPPGVRARYNERTPTLLGEALQRVYGDEAWEAFRKQTAAVRVVPVGAAGNGILRLDAKGTGLVHQQLDFPFAPALWSTVTSASAQVGTGLAAYSNWGEVVRDGTGPFQAAGTSFAAPRLSALEALYLLTGGAVACDGHTPPLGYADLADDTGPTWENRTVPSAAGAYCHEFIARTTL